jgi:hypothetical protein
VKQVTIYIVRSVEVNTNKTERRWVWPKAMAHHCMRYQLSEFINTLRNLIIKTLDARAANRCYCCKFKAYVGQIRVTSYSRLGPDGGTNVICLVHLQKQGFTGVNVLQMKREPYWLLLLNLDLEQ